jgi:hypothetical protein
MGNFFFILSPKIYSIQDEMSIKKIIIKPDYNWNYTYEK